MRRWGVVAIAAVVVAALAVFTTWFVAVRDIDDAFGGRVGEECRSTPRRAFESFVGMTLVPRTPELAEASRAIRRVIGSDRWRIVVESTGSDRPGERRRDAIVRDGDAVEFRRNDGTRARLTPDRTLLTADGSTFSLSTCDDPSFTYRVVPREAACIERVVRGDDTVFTFRAAGSSTTDCAPTRTRVEHEVVLHRGEFERWRFRVITPARTSVETWTVRAPVALDDRAPWTVIPEWFVELVAR